MRNSKHEILNPKQIPKSKFQILNQKLVLATMRLVFLGPPGSGKGTQAKQLADEFKLDLIATGDILRDAIRSDTELGKKVKQYVESGRLVPDELMIELVREKIESSEDGFILDGFPRTINQAKGLEEVTDIDKVIYLKCDPETIVNRLGARRVCPLCAHVYNLETNPPLAGEVCDECKVKLEQREDDSESVIRERIRVYEEATLLLLRFYWSKLIVVDAGSDIEGVYRMILEGLSVGGCRLSQTENRRPNAEKK